MRRGQRKRANTDTWVRQIYRLKFQILTGKCHLATGKARDLAVRQNHLPREALEIPLRTVYRVAQELKLSPWETGLGGGI